MASIPELDRILEKCHPEETRCGGIFDTLMPNCDQIHLYEADRYEHDDKPFTDDHLFKIVNLCIKHGKLGIHMGFNDWVDHCFVLYHINNKFYIVDSYVWQRKVEYREFDIQSIKIFFDSIPSIDKINTVYNSVPFISQNHLDTKSDAYKQVCSLYDDISDKWEILFKCDVRNISKMTLYSVHCHAFVENELSQRIAID
jgi:hypothetical protein